MSYGCPSIVSRYGASPEVVGDTGLIINFIDSDQIISSIIKYSQMNLEEKKRMRERAYTRAYEKFSFKKRLNEFKQITY